MAIKLSTKSIISQEALREIGEARLEESKALLDAGFYAGSVYLGGCSVECYLKVAVCVTLGWDKLFATFKVHDLEGLLLYSGFNARLRADADVADSFAKIRMLWRIEGNDDVRYRRPAEFDEPIAKRFLQYVSDPTMGVVSWLRIVTS